jgi:hypothetical protein
MRRSIGVLLLLFAFVLLLSSPASAQPSQGINSTDQGTTGGRNLNGYGGTGVPHCHLLNVPSAEGVLVYPSHTGHANAGGDIFDPDSNCNGFPNPA